MTPYRRTSVRSTLSAALIRLIYNQANNDFAVNFQQCIKWQLEAGGQNASVAYVVHHDGVPIEELSPVGSRLTKRHVPRTT